MTADRKPKSTALAALGYVPLLFPLPLFASGGDEFAQSHGRQSLLIQIVLISFWFLVWILDFLLRDMLGRMLLLGFFFKALAWVIHYPLGLAVSLGYIALAVVGIIRSLAGQHWRIPVVGALAERLTF